MDAMIYAGIGARDTPPEVLQRMRDIGAALGRAGWTLRTGGARGADTAFEEGARSVGAPVEVYLPWDTYERDVRRERGWPDGWVAATRELHREAALHHLAWERLGRGPRAMMARNVAIILGHDMDSPARMVIAWTERGLLKGGTSHGLRCAAAHGIGTILNLGDPSPDLSPLRRAVQVLRGPG